MNIKFTIIAGCLLAFYGTAQSQSLNLNPGNWKLIVSGEALGESYYDEESECMTPEDATENVSSLLNEVMAEVGCTIGTISNTENIYKSDLTCPAETMMTGGELTMLTSPEAFTLNFEMKSIVSSGEADMFIYMISYRDGPC